MIFSIISQGETRPTILEANKGIQYHLQWGRYALGAANNHLHQKFIDKIHLNKRFYKGDQWGADSEAEAFLKDEEDQDRNRLAIVDNIIRPMVEQFRGNAIRMNINFKFKSISPQAINRRETKLQENLTYSEIANKPGNPFGEAMKKRLPVGDDQAETRAIFNNSYVDDFARAINYMTKFVTERNEFVDKQVDVAEDLAFAGLAVMKHYEHNGHMYFKNVPADSFFWDRSARRKDFKDAEFMGEVIEMSSSEIFEHFPEMYNAGENKKNIESYAKFCSENRVDQSTGRISSGKIPVVFSYWKDGQYDEYGYVVDRFGYTFCTKVNFTYEGEEGPRYTTKDVVEPPTPRAKKIMKGKRTKKIFSDNLRTCIFIPAEIIASAEGVGSSNDKVADVVLDWGMAPYQETDTLDSESVCFPYKAATWSYLDGEVMSPLDDAVDPQRMVNRILSVAENQINNSRGSGMVYDKDMLEDEAEATRNMNQSKPVGIRAKGRGIQNAIGQYDATIKQGTSVMFDIMEAVKASTQRTTGVNDALKGESTGSDQLVGVTQLMIQRGSLMQEPFYNAVTSVFKQSIQAIGTVGKRIYSENERNIAIATGDDMAEVIKISKDMRAEDFRCFVTRENSDEMLRNAADQMLLTIIQIQLPTGPLLDQKRFADLYGRSTPDDVASAIRAYAKEKEEMMRIQAREEKKMEAEMSQEAENEMAMQNEMMMEQTARQDIENIEARRHDKSKELLKGLSKIAGTNKQAEKLIIEKAKEAA
jgi:hypothetical protein